MATASPPLAALPRDPAVPRRDELLDTDVMAERFADLLGTGIDACRRKTARYEPARAVRAGYAVDVDGATYHAGARTRGRDLQLWTFPDDPALASLACLAGESPALGALLGRPVAVRIVKYKPERQAIARCVDEEGATIAFAKVYGHGATYACHVQRSVSGRLAEHVPSLRVPRVLAFSAAEGLVVSEPLEGPRLKDLEPPERERGMRRLGAGLARLHALPSPPRLIYRGVLPAKLRHAAQLVSFAWPEGRQAVADLLRELVARRPRPDAPFACLHGDLNESNVVVGDDRLGLLDLDAFGLGPAAVDLGVMLARLRYQRSCGRLDGAGERRLAAALLGGYAESGSLPDAHALRWHTAASLLVRRAATPVVRLEPRRLARLPDMVAEARAALGID